MTVKLERLRPLLLTLGIAAVLLVTLLGGLALAAEPPPLPHTFYGTVLLDGVPAPVGSSLVVRVGGTAIASDTIFLSAEGSSYRLHVKGDHPDTPAVEGATLGAELRFVVAGHTAITRASWQGGEHTRLNLEAFSQPQPPQAGFVVNPTAAPPGTTFVFSDTSSDLDGDVTAWQWDFGDSSQSTLQHPTHVYTASGRYTVTLTITDSDGLQAAAQRVVRALSLPQPEFGWLPAEPHAGEPVQFQDQSGDADGDVTAWGWDFGDGASSQQQHPTHVFGAAGDYFVTLVITDSDGNSDSLTQQLRVGTPARAAFSWAPDPALVSQTVQFQDQSSSIAGPIVAWQWDFDDGSGSSAQNPAHNYGSSFGLFAVTLTITDSAGYTDTASSLVRVTAGLQAGFAYTPTRPAGGEPVQFRSTSSQPDPTAAIVAYYWDFGNGATSIVPEPVRTFNSGHYTVTLTVTDSHGLSNSASQALIAGSNPLADAGGPYTADEGENVTFDASASSHPDGDSLVQYEWDLDGDGLYETTGMIVTQLQADDVAGAVRLRVTDALDRRDVDTALLTVRNISPVVTAGPDQAVSVGQPVVLPPASYTDPGTDSHNMSLDWGDGTTDTAPVSGGLVTGTHVYSPSGIYTATLCVADDDGGQGCDSFTVNVSGPPLLAVAQRDGLLLDANGDSQPSPGDTLAYTLTVANSGTSPALGLVYTGQLSVHSHLLPASIQLSQGTLRQESPLILDLGDLPAGQNLTVTYQVTVANPLPAGVEMLANQGQLDGINTPPTVSDDPDTAAAYDATLTPVVAAPELAVSKSDFRSSARPGQLLGYRITISNTGNQEATGIRITDTLPAWVSFQGADYGGRLLPGGVVTWPVFSLAGGADSYRTVLVRVDEQPPLSMTALTNSVTVRDDGQNGPEATLTDNQAQDETALQSGPDLWLPGLDTSSLVITPQNGSLAGTAQVMLANGGSREVSDPFALTLFEDRDGDGTLSAADQLLGQQTVTPPLAAGSTLTLPVTLSGTLTFAGSTIHAFADSGLEITELDEGNNLADSAAACRFVPQPGQSEPAVEWRWPLNDVSIPDPDSVQSFSTPLVVQLTDDNGDGLIDEGDVPDVVFVSFEWLYSCGENSCNWYDVGYRLRAVKGDSGELIFSVGRANFQSGSDYGRNTLAAGDVDGDGVAEIIVADQGAAGANRLYAFEHDGTFKWQSDNYRTHPEQRTTDRDNPSLADLDGDGSPEIIVGANVFDGGGRRLWAGSLGQGWQSNLNRTGLFSNLSGAASIAADLDLDGQLEVVAGNTAYRADGSVYWHRADLADGFPAVGNFDADLFPEIAVISRGTVRLHEHDGTLIWGPHNLPGRNPEAGGPPVVGDVDGDGLPEIGVAGSNRYTVYDTDGTLLWQVPTQDSSSGVTGSTIFDLDGDGRYEIVYRDEQYLRIYRGSDGAVLHQLEMSSITANEMPVVADVDNDGHAEIIASSDELRSRGGSWIRTNGIFVLGNDNWVGSRPVWNQNSYHVDNVNAAGTIPAVEAWGWLDHNTYRSNVAPDPFAAPDLTAGYLRADLSAYPAVVTLTARIGNGGAAPARAGTSVTFYDGDPAAGGTFLTRTVTAGTLLPGHYEDVSFAWHDPIRGSRTIFVLVDEPGQVTECRETNNSHHFYYQVAGLDLKLVKENGDTRLAPGQVSTYTITVENIGTEHATGIRLTDTLPAHTSFAAASDSGSAAGSSVTWPAFALDSGQSVTRSVTVQLDSLFPAGFATITNTATFTANWALTGPDVTPDNDTATDEDLLDASPDLQVTNDDGLASTDPGALVTYTIRVHNAGSQDSSGVVLSDTLPPESAFVWASGGGALVPGITATTVVTWPAFALGSGQSVTRQLTVRVAQILPAGADALLNTATARDDGSSGPDGDPADNTAADLTVINAAPDLVVSKSDGRERVAAGDILVYRITAGNDGVQGATGVVLADTLPAYSLFLGASHGATATASADGESIVVLWPPVSLAAGEQISRAVTIQVSDTFPVALEPFINTIAVTDDGLNGPDTAPGNNVYHDQTDLTVAADQTIPTFSASLNSNAQTREVSGTAHLLLKNQGNRPVADPFAVTVFEDRDGDGRWSSGDNRLAEVTVTAPITTGGLLTLNLPVAGTLRFAGNLLYAHTDSGSVIAELDESNNTNNTGLACRYLPPPQNFAPEIELHWPIDAPDPIVQSNSLESGSMALVVNLTDDNADSRIDDQDVPDILFVTYGGPRVVRAIHSRTGAAIWNVIEWNEPGIGRLLFEELSAGDIDGDGLAEVIVSGHIEGTVENRLLALEHDGTVKWISEPYRTHPRTNFYTDRDQPTIADLDLDGLPEVIVGANVFNNNGTLRWVGSSGQAFQANNSATNNNWGGSISIVADLDLDGYPELVTGKTAYRHDGSIYWDLNEADGYPAVGNFDADPYPEVVVVADAYIRLHEHDGTLIWGPHQIPQRGPGGAPTVADFDGDGLAEVSTSARWRYAVWEHDGTLKWQAPIDDDSSGMVGSTVFDLDGDGRFEAIHRDEGYLRILDGATGSVIYQQRLTSVTQNEEPVVADVDRDGNAEIIVTSDRRGNPSTYGLFVIGDSRDNWVNSRPIWNQQAYHVDNVNADSTIPLYQEWSWLTHNTYRSNVVRGGGGTYVPDLTASHLRINTTPYPTVISMTVRVGNGGARLVEAGSPVSFYYTLPAMTETVRIATKTTTRHLAPGEYEDVSLAWWRPGIHAATITAAADDLGDGTGLENECNEANNRTSAAYELPAPTVTANDDRIAVEGDLVFFDGSYSGVGPSTAYTATWLFGDGTVVTGSLQASHAYADDGLYQALLRVYDDRQTFGQDEVRVQILNARPTIEAGPPLTITEGVTEALAAAFSDPGTGDTHTGLIAWGDGSVGEGQVVETAGSGTLHGVHNYPDDASLTTEVCISDDEGATHCDARPVTVENAPPLVAAAAGQTVPVSDSFTVTLASFTDLGLLDTHLAVIDWGDGTVLTRPASLVTGVVSASHTYTAAAVYTVTITVIDDDGGVGWDSLLLTASTDPTQIALKEIVASRPAPLWLGLLFALLLALTLHTGKSRFKLP